MAVAVETETADAVTVIIAGLRLAGSSVIKYVAVEKAVWVLTCVEVCVLTLTLVTVTG